MTLDKMEELQNIIEDYINLAQSRHFVKDEDLPRYLEKMRDHWADLVEYVDSEVENARQDVWTKRQRSVLAAPDKTFYELPRSNKNIGV